MVFDDFGDVYGFYYVLSVFDFDNWEFWEFVWIIWCDLFIIEGVVKVNVIGV